MLEVLILTALGLWLILALRSCLHRKGGCGGERSARKQGKQTERFTAHKQWGETQ